MQIREEREERRGKRVSIGGQWRIREGRKKGGEGRNRRGRRKIIGRRGSELSLHKTSICSWPNLYLLPRRGGGSLIPIDQGGRRGEEKRH